MAEKAARELYFQFIHPAEICKITGVPQAELKKWIFHYDWKNDRDDLIEDDLKKVKGTIKTYTHSLQDICRDSVAIIKDTVRRIRYEDEKVSIDELKTLSSILSDIDKLARLETGRPTSILMTSFNQDDVINLIKDIQAIDPFCDYIEHVDSTQTDGESTEQPLLLEGIPPEIGSPEQEVEATPISNESTESDIQSGEKENIH